MSGPGSIADDRAQEEPAFLDDDGPSAEVPPFITTTNARSCTTFGLVKPCRRPSPGARLKKTDSIQSTTGVRYDAPLFFVGKAVAS